MNCSIQRVCSDSLQHFVQGNPIFGFMREGLTTGQILPCLRKNEFHFYDTGARLFRFTQTNVFSHSKYVDEFGGGERKLLESEQKTEEVFNRIRKTAQKHRSEKVRNELVAVHHLFSKLAITRLAHKPGQLALIDIEARFGNGVAGTLPTAIIDLVFLTPNRHLLFVEAKCLHHPAVQSTTKAAVEGQVVTYEGHIRSPGVLDAYNVSLRAQLELLGRPVEAAVGIYPRVPVLLLMSNSKQTIGRNNRWLADRLSESKDWTAASERPLVIDGRECPVAAVRGAIERLTADC